MKTKFLLLLVLAAASVGAAVVYVIVREPSRPAEAKAPCQPGTRGCAPFSNVDPPAPPQQHPVKSDTF